jgi:excisionase family DNA binding protein
MLAVSTSTLHHMLYKRSGPKSYKVGRHRRYDPEDVKAWLERRALYEKGCDE